MYGVDSHVLSLSLCVCLFAFVRRRSSRRLPRKRPRTLPRVSRRPRLTSCCSSKRGRTSSPSSCKFCRMRAPACSSFWDAAVLKVKSCGGKELPVLAFNNFVGKRQQQKHASTTVLVGRQYSSTPIRPAFFSYFFLIFLIFRKKYTAPTSNSSEIPI